MTFVNVFLPWYWHLLQADITFSCAFVLEQEYHLKNTFNATCLPRWRMEVRKLKTILVAPNAFQDSEFPQHKEACVMTQFKYSQNIFLNNNHLNNFPDWSVSMIATILRKWIQTIRWAKWNENSRFLRRVSRLSFLREEGTEGALTHEFLGNRGVDNPGFWPLRALSCSCYFLEVALPKICLTRESALISILTISIPEIQKRRGEFGGFWWRSWTIPEFCSSKSKVNGHKVTAMNGERRCGVDIYRGILLLSHHEPWNLAIYNETDGSRENYAERTKSGKDKYHVISVTCEI